VRYTICKRLVFKALLTFSTKFSTKEALKQPHFSLYGKFRQVFNNYTGITGKTFPIILFVKKL